MYARDTYDMDTCRQSETSSVATSDWPKIRQKQSKGIISLKISIDEVDKIKAYLAHSNPKTGTTSGSPNPGLLACVSYWVLGCTVHTYQAYIHTTLQNKSKTQLEKKEPYAPVRSVIKGFILFP